MTGFSSIYINGALIKQTKQKKGQKLVQDWLVNGIGRSFGDDSMHYVDELYIFNRALKPVEVQALYEKCIFNRMVIHYGFQKGNNSLLLDQSGLQNDAIPIGGKPLCLVSDSNTDLALKGCSEFGIGLIRMLAKVDAYCVEGFGLDPHLLRFLHALHSAPWDLAMGEV